jgi:tetratricopeptide (TPR) repeat protein
LTLQPGSTLGPYEVIAQIGAGGMGEVYRARDPRLGRDVAIKVLPSHLAHDALATARLRQEALAAAALDHPFICKVFEIGDQDPGLFVVMEYVTGQTLHARLAAGSLSTREALKIAGEIAEALEEAHSKRIVHRDLKPANVMLTPQGRVKVMDFGLAKQLVATTATDTIMLTRAALTEWGVRVGTPDYMSPEQVLGSAVDERSDLFSFGIVLCELLTGRHPFRRPSSGETMTAILRDIPDIACDGELPGSLSVLLRRLMAKALDERCATIAEVRNDLDRVSNLAAGEAASGTSEATPRASRRTMVGRDSERAALLRGLNAAIGGRGSIVLVGGEPGIGKTRLTQDLIADARQRGCLSLVGHCYEGEGAPPYIPFIEILEYSARVIPPATFRRTLGDSAPEVAKLMPELRRIFPDIPPPIELPPEQHRRFLFNAYREFIDRSCRVTPAAVVLEDLHWADEPTLLLLQHLAHTMATTPLLVVGTYRDVELDVTRPFARTLETLIRQRLASRISLQRLSQSAVESMLRGLSGQPPPSSLSRVVFEETDGNPFFVEEVFQHLAEDGKLFDAGGVWRSDLRVDTLAVPEGVRLVIGRRLQRLSEAARRVLTTAAIVGRTFSVPVLEALENRAADVVVDALEEAERAHLVAAESSPREARYRFVHELIRQTLAEALSMPRRQRLHARVAEAIERVYPATPEKYASALAHHLYQAGTAVDAGKTSQHLLIAAEQARTSAAHEESLAHLDRALSLWEGDRDSRVADIHKRRATALRSLGRSSEAIDALEQAIALFDETAHREDSAASSFELAYMLIWYARIDAAIRVTGKALTRLGDSAPVLRSSLLFVHAASTCLGDPDAGFATLAEAQRIQQTLDNPDVDRLAAMLEVHMRGFVAHFERAIDVRRDAAQRCRAARDVWGDVDTAVWEPLAAIYCGRPLDAAPLLEEYEPVAERVGHQTVLWFLKLSNAMAAFTRGELDAAESAARRSREFGQAQGIGWRFADDLYLGLISFCQGRHAEAIAHVRDAMNVEPPRTHFSGISAATLTWMLAREGDPGAADVLNAHPPHLPQRGHIPTQGAWGALAKTVESLALLGRRDEAAALLESTEELVATGVQWYANSMFATAAGVAAACAREWTRAEAHHHRAIAQADTTYWACRPDARVWYAEMLFARAEAGDRDRARVLLAEALSLYESIGMPGFARRTGARLAARDGLA